MITIKKNAIRIYLILTAGIVLTSVILVSKEAPARLTPSVKRQKIMLHNTFKDPQKVVQYYVARDAQGSIWAGMMKREREEFTTWKAGPQKDIFYQARQYQIMPVKYDKKDALVEVKYDLIAMVDAHGSKASVRKPNHQVKFRLKKVDKKWKIVSPDPSTLIPVVR